MQLDRQHFSGSTFELRCPVEVLVEEIQRLLDSDRKRSPEWTEDCSSVLMEAFRSQEPADEFDSAPREVE